MLLTNAQTTEDSKFPVEKWGFCSPVVTIGTQVLVETMFTVLDVNT